MNIFYFILIRAVDMFIAHCAAKFGAVIPNIYFTRARQIVCHTKTVI